MSEALTIGLTEKQRETLLCGLRYVRSSLLLDMRDPDVELDAQRNRDLAEISRLAEQLRGSGARSERAEV